MVSHRFSEFLAPQHVIAPSSHLNESLDEYRLLCWKLLFSQNVDGIIPAFAKERPEVSLIPTLLKVKFSYSPGKCLGSWLYYGYSKISPWWYSYAGPSFTHCAGSVVSPLQAVLQLWEIILFSYLRISSLLFSLYIFFSWIFLLSSHQTNSLTQTVKHLPAMRETQVRWLGWEDPMGKEVATHTPVLLPEKSHGQRSLIGYSPWRRKESDMTERLHFPFTYLPTLSLEVSVSIILS